MGKYVDFIFNYFNCNIEKNCPVGCPCSDFDCVATTPAPTTQPPTTPALTTPTTSAPTTSAPTTPAPTVTIPVTTTATNGNVVLVLNTLNSNNNPTIVDFNGRLTEFFLK